MTKDLNAIANEIESLRQQSNIARAKLSAAMRAARVWRDTDNQLHRLIETKQMELAELVKKFQ